MEDYGIQKEGQMFSGRFTALKKQFSDGDTDAMSLFNTQHMIEEQVATIYSKFRIEFFEEFDGIERNTNLDDTLFVGIRETFRRVCTNPSKKLRQKASAYYRVAYTNTKHLSFAWLVADILAYNRQQFLLQPENLKFSLCPLFDQISKHMVTCMQVFKTDFDTFQTRINNCNQSKEDVDDMTRFIAGLCQSYEGKENFKLH